MSGPNHKEKSRDTGVDAGEDDEEVMDDGGEDIGGRDLWEGLGGKEGGGENQYDTEDTAFKAISNNSPW